MSRLYLIAPIAFALSACAGALGPVDEPIAAAPVAEDEDFMFGGGGLFEEEGGVFEQEGAFENEFGIFDDPGLYE